ncbi:MAG: adenylate kinase [Gemmatimonadota bacterium]
MIPDLQRTAVVGTSGVGKTVFAGRLAAITRFPHVELDALHWGPGWRLPTESDFRARVATALAGDRWIADGNYSAVRDLVWGNATAILWLDYSLPLAFWRVLRRSVWRSLTHEELFAGNRESLRLTFLSRESLLWVVLTRHGRRRRSYRALFEGGCCGDAAVVVFQRPREAEAFLRRLAEQHGGAGPVRA